MSGDVQARKRRDKKKKKEDGPEEVVFQHQHQPTTSPPNVTEDLNIHVQKEASTGGGLCAKLIFFILLTLLTTLIGLIITEHRGLTDLDTIDTESRFAQLFDGWIDKSLDDHESPDEHGIAESGETLSEEDEDDHEDEESEVSEEKEVDASDEEDDDHEDEDDEEADEEDEEESDVQDDDNVDTNEDTNEISRDAEDDDDIEESQDDDEPNEDDDEEEPQDSDEELYERSLPIKKRFTREEEEEEEEDEGYSEEQDESAEPFSRTKSEESLEDDEEDDDEEAPDDDVSVEVTTKTSFKKPISKTSPEKIKTEDKTIEEEDEEEEEDDDDDEGDDAKEEEEQEDAENINPQEETENSNMVVKFAVGTALLAVAHVVLVQKWKNAKAAEAKPQTTTSTEETRESTPPDLSRRNTIVTPPALEEIEQDIENVEEEYSEDDEDYDSEDDSKSKPGRAKMRYQELQSTYSHTLSPEWEPAEVRGKGNRNSEEEEEEEEENDDEEQPEGDEEQPEGDEDYDDEISENEDEELLRRLEAKYGKIQQSDDEPEDEEEDDEEELEEEGDEKYRSWKRAKESPRNVAEDTDSETERNWSKERSGAQSVYEFSNITNSDDMKINEELDRAQQNIDAAYALTLFNKILEGNPSSPRALYGKAQSLDTLAEQKRSNNLLQEAIATYQQVLKTEHVPDTLFQVSAERCIDRIRFRGLYGQAVSVHKMLINKFPDIPKFANDLAVTYLTTNRITEAKKVLQETLSKWPDDGFALVHYGFILKTTDNNLEDAVQFLQKGIATRETGVIDGRFYFHLGDALTRLGKKEEALAVYEDGVKNKVFLSKYQRSLYNVNRLTGKPWWKKEDTPYVKYFKYLESNWKNIRDEGLSILDKSGNFKPEAENLRDVGDWKQFELFARGIKNVKNCKQCPVTCSMIETFRDATECRRGQIKFSVMHPGTHVWPHCGPTNCRLRAHLGLKVPSNTYIRVAEETLSWEEGKFIIFDDSFEHEVWHNGTSTRLVLIIDFWHPELTKQEKSSLSSI